jgi:hypothetical protein
LAFKTPAGTDISEKGSENVLFVVSKDYGAEIAKKMDEAKTYPVNLTCTVEKAAKGKNWLVIVSKVEFREAKDDPAGKGSISLGDEKLEIEQGEKREVTIRVERKDFTGDVEITVDSADARGVSVEPAKGVVKANEKEYRLTVAADKDSRDGEVKVTANAKGVKSTTATIKVYVKPK